MNLANGKHSIYAKKGTAHTRMNTRNFTDNNSKNITLNLQYKLF